MEEKKLTDEEIVNAWKYCLTQHGECEKCPYVDWGCAIGNDDILDLIHRLQDEKKHLSEEYDRIGECFAKLKDRNAEQKAEIERMKKRHGVALLRNDDLDLENYELKKQVDELKANQIIECHGMLKTCSMVKQAVKDTAKEIYRKAEKKAYFKDGGHYDKDRYLLDMDNLKEIVNGYGVEVE